jgi:hypothetical protein
MSRMTSASLWTLLTCLCLAGAAARGQALPADPVTQPPPAAAPASAADVSLEAFLASLAPGGQPAVPLDSQSCCYNAAVACEDGCLPCPRIFGCTYVGNSCTYTCRCQITRSCHGQ